MKKAIITSDLVHSTQLSIKQRLWLNQKIEELLKFLSKNKLLKKGDFELFRGDSFQCLIHNPALSLKVALLIKTHIKSLKEDKTLSAKNAKANTKSFDVRLSLSVGEVEMVTNHLGTSDGEAFRLSGRKLDEMKKEKRTFCITTRDKFEKELDMESFLLDILLSKATALQCEVMYWKLLGNNETWIADKLQINQSAVNQRSTSGGWHALEKMIKRFEEMYHD